MSKIDCPRLALKNITKEICESCHYYDDKEKKCKYREMYNPMRFGEKNG